MRGTSIAFGALLAGLFLSLIGTAYARGAPIGGGELQILGAEGQPVGACPLKHTDVEADVVGFVARVTVKQTFHNPLDRKIEAIYIFPLPPDAAVDDMVMTVGDRRIVGQIKPREEAREIYEAAKAAGHVASLLDQERPNIFTQSVANIEPGVEVIIEISYVETLKYEDGLFEWVFPMVVGPRYIPGRPTSTVPPVTPEHQGKVNELDKTGAPEVPVGQRSSLPSQGSSSPSQGTGWSPDTDQVPDASRVTPPVVKPGYRAGHDISVAVHLDAGTELYDLKSELHEVDIAADGLARATVTLKNVTEIPNKDFILHYRLATTEIGDAFLVHADERGTYFTLVLQPPERVVPRDIVPREIIFVLDTSGSMSGFPIEKAKKVMALAIDAMGSEDTFNLITFAGSTSILWGEPRPNTPENRADAQAFLTTHRGGGGTEMMTAINAALAPAKEFDGIRVVCFMTDGYVGNEFAIIDAVKKNAGTTRVFSFGIGNAVNRFLLDGMAHAGRGEVEYVTLAGQGDEAAQRFHERILAPVLTDIEIDWGDLPVADIYPAYIPDLFSAKPLMIHGRLTGPAEGTITLHGITGAGPFGWQITVDPPKAPQDHNALVSLWARAKVKDLMHRDLGALQSGTFPDDLRAQITALGVEFRLITQFTSFVAVEEMTVTVGGEPTTITVPVEMPDGVSYEGVFGRGGGLPGSFSGLPPAGAAAAQRSMRGWNRTAKRKIAPIAGARLYAFDSEVQEEAKAALSPEAKLAETLLGLAEKVEKEGKDGDLTVGKLRVIKYKVDVMIHLRDTSPETLKALKELGFVQTGESKAIKLLIGTIDVRKLIELVELEAVIRVSPVVAGTKSR